jgi:hypothetical protein
VRGSFFGGTGDGEALRLDEAKTAFTQLHTSGAGEYRVNYCPLSAGVFDLAVLVLDKHIKGSPFRLEVSAGDACEHFSRAFGRGLRSTFVGQEATFTVTLSDTYGNAHTAGGAVLDVRFEECSAVAVSRSASVMDSIDEHCMHRVSDMYDGSYTVRYTITRAGEYKIHVRVGSVSSGPAVHPNVQRELMRGEHLLRPIAGSPFSANVVGIDAVMCSAHGSALEAITAGQRSSFEVTLRSKRGELVSLPHPTDNKLLSLKAALANSAEAAEAVPAQIEELGLGLYRCMYTLQLAGTYELGVYLDNAPVGGSPWLIAVSAASAHPPHCCAYGDGLQKGFEAQLATFKVDIIDNFGNRVLDLSAVRLEGEVTPLAVLSRAVDLLRRIPIYFAPMEPGVFAAEYLAGEPGEYELGVRISGIPISGSPFNVHVSGVDNTQCVAEGAGLAMAVAGHAALFSVVTRTHALELVRLPPADDLFQVLIAICAASSDHVRKFVPVKDVSYIEVSRGRYDVSYAPLEAAADGSEAFLCVKVLGREIANSPFKLTISAGHVEASNCTAFGEGLTSCREGVLGRFVVQTRDRFSNLCNVDLSHIEATMRRVTDGAQMPACVAHTTSRGEYSVEYKPSLQGEFRVTVAVGGEEIPQSPMLLSVYGSVAGKTMAFGIGVEGMVTRGERASFTISARTADNEHCDVPDGALTALLLEGRVLGSAAVACDIHRSLSFDKDKCEGMYEATYTPLMEGELQVHVLLRGQHIRHSPFTLMCVSSWTSASESSAARPGDPARDSPNLNAYGLTSLASTQR